MTNVIIDKSFCKSSCRVWSAIGMASVHFVKQSNTFMFYINDQRSEMICRRPKMSISIRSKGPKNVIS